MVRNTPEKIERIYDFLLVLLLVLQPILELVWFNNGTIGEVAGFTIPTLVRFGLVGIIGVLSFAVVKFNRKYLLLLAYAVLIVVYTVFHHDFCVDFYSLVPGDFDYSLVNELFYIIRMLVPIAVIYFVFHSTITKSTMKKVILWIAGFSSLSVVITNILKISLGSYSDKKILGNVFDWFFNVGKYTFNDLSSKGFFYWSIFSTVLVLIYPMIIHWYFKEKKKRYLFLIILQGIALYMFGTKATTFSVLIELFVMLGVYLFCTVIKKDEQIQKMQIAIFTVVIAIFVFAIPYTPSLSRMSFDEDYKKAIDEAEKEREKEAFEGDFEEFLDKNYKFLSVKEEFLLESYSYKYDLEFWEDLLNHTGPSQRMQNRIIEQRMLERVKEINNDPMDTYFGLGYTRTSNIYNLEKDFIYQFYSMGIIGVILLLGPYIMIILVAMLWMLIKFKDKANIENCSLVLGLGLSLFLAYYSGNVMESLGITIVIGALAGYLLKLLFEKC